MKNKLLDSTARFAIEPEPGEILTQDQTAVVLSARWRPISSWGLAELYRQERGPKSVQRQSPIDGKWRRCYVWRDVAAWVAEQNAAGPVIRPMQPIKKPAEAPKAHSSAKRAA
ncbi:hypothetical protein [Acidisoma sp. S159]|uniref:hypothetical protein n=1 Tax=Acidisoma sp. S159 TaxID=1747225 RepID=UPI00131BC356|nr:hypothetical protein [Acidisoma sp. S159]